jgi:tripartite-type tricarboxylate transporter receptor subunit TctC
VSLRTGEAQVRRRDFIAVLGGASAAWPLGLHAQEYPTRQITLISPWPAGGAVDALCRAIAPGLGERLGKNVIVDDRPGAGSVLGTAVVAKAAPDGYTLVSAGSGSLAISATVRKNLPYDPAKDFALIAFLSRIPFVLVVNPQVPAYSVTDLVKWTKQSGSKPTYASGGPGSPHHLLMEMLQMEAGIELIHVPYKGSAPALTDVVAGHVPMMFSDTVPALPLVREGKVRAIGVSTGTRLPSAPEIPTVAEAGAPGYDGAGWSILAAPAKTPPAIVAKLHEAAKQVMALREVQDQLIKLGMIPMESPPQEKLQDFVNAEIMRWGKIVQASGLAGTE